MRREEKATFKYDIASKKLWLIKKFSRWISIASELDSELVVS